MKYVGMVLALGLAIFMMLGVMIYSFLPATTPPANTPVAPAPLPAIVVEPVDVPDPAQLETDFMQREIIYKTQIEGLQQTLQERQRTYQEQLQTLSQQEQAAQQQFDELTHQEQALQLQVQDFEAARAERVALYQQQLEEAGTQYAAQAAALQAALQDTLAKVEQANAQ